MISSPVLSLHHVDPSGAIELVAANIPYSSLLWTRRMSTVGDFTADLLIPLPAPWPGRYIVTASGHDEVGVVEKVSVDEGGGVSPATISGRFLESVWARWELEPGAKPSAGANWRQAVTRSCLDWHHADLPAIVPGAGTEAQSGSSYKVVGDVGKSAMDLIYSETASRGARPLLSYDRSKSGDIGLRIIDGEDRTRSQELNPQCVFSLSLASVTAIHYEGDVSASASSVVAYHEGQDGRVTKRTVAVPGFDAATGWMSTAVEDVGSLLDVQGGSVPSASQIESAGALRAYDHMPVVSIDFEAARAGYRDDWDLCDTVEVEIPSLSLVAIQRIEEARESYDHEGARLELTAGTRQMSKLSRALLGRR